MVEVTETPPDGNRVPRIRSTGRRVTPERMHRIAEVAIDIALESGFAAVTMQAVANGTGYVRPVLYDCYGTPENILLSILDRESTNLLDVLNGDTLADKNRTANAVSGYLMAYFNAILAHPRAWQLFTLPTESSTLAVREYVGDVRERLRRGIEDWLRSTTRDLPEPSDTEALSILVLAAIDAIGARIIADPQSYDAHRVDAFLESLTRSAYLTPTNLRRRPGS